MNKPEHIEQWAWDKALDIEIDADFTWDGQCHGQGHERDTRIAIATALMEARAEEREGCALVVDERRDSFYQNYVREWNAFLFIAQAIRERNDK